MSKSISELQHLCKDVFDCYYTQERLTANEKVVLIKLCKSISTELNEILMQLEKPFQKTPTFKELVSAIFTKIFRK